MLTSTWTRLSKGGAAQHANDDDGATQRVPASPTASSSSVPDFVPDSGSAIRSASEPRDSDRHGDDAQASASPAAASSTGVAVQPANDYDGATQPVHASPTASSSSSPEIADWSPDADTDAVETA